MKRRFIRLMMMNKYAQSHYVSIGGSVSGRIKCDYSNESQSSKFLWCCYSFKYFKTEKNWV